ncbi:thioredoxin family protein [Microbacter margulisiae]|uniref:Glutaredoxin-like YruB-family protein n=1 Tax=Microbacter margulisiae TaxID=1350067 RepID=A0A7W5DR33_9PORP|nr:thioredoxin family protein [Microbacter margulisiae]MBB3187163.1 glutaredoxin-like YruB-family protein [Microbacter margulisiae]
MEKVSALADFQQKATGHDKVFLLLYKAGNEQSLCAYSNLDSVVNQEPNIPVFSADVAEVRDIHPHFGITSAPTLLVFENGQYVNAIKGCQESSYYKALMESAIYQAKAKAEGKTVKRVTVYSTPTCTWCNTLKTWLHKNNIPYTDVDVSRDQHAAEDLVRRTGQQGVPQTDINGQIVVGFNQARLKELLEI